MTTPPGELVPIEWKTWLWNKAINTASTTVNDPVAGQRLFKEWWDGLEKLARALYENGVRNGNKRPLG